MANELKAALSKEEAIGKASLVERTPPQQGQHHLRKRTREGRWYMQSSDASRLEHSTDSTTSNEADDDETLDSKQTKKCFETARRKRKKVLQYSSREDQDTRLKQALFLVGQKDAKIADLQKDCKQKDKSMEYLVREKDEMKKKIEDLEMRCSEAIGEHDSNKAKLCELQKAFEEVEFREKEAQRELDLTRTQLSAAKQEKETEISKLREEFHRQGVVTSGVQAERERELVEEMQRKLAEERGKRAQDKASYLKDTARHVEEVRCAEEKLRKLNVRVQELEVERNQCFVQ